MADTDTYILRASLGRSVHRDIEIRASKSLHDLAAAIVGAYDFDFDHAFGFYSKLKGRYYDSPEKYELFADIGESDAGSVKNTTVAQVFDRPRKAMLFLFDYGDEWLFKVTLVGRGTAEKGIRYPRVVASKGEAPEQYPSPDDEVWDEDE